MLFTGEKLTNEECNELFQNQEDPQGNINYEGEFRRVFSGYIQLKIYIKARGFGAM